MRTCWIQYLVEQPGRCCNHELSQVVIDPWTVPFEWQFFLSAQQRSTNTTHWCPFLRQHRWNCRAGTDSRREAVQSSMSSSLQLQLRRCHLYVHVSHRLRLWSRVLPLTVSSWHSLSLALLLLKWWCSIRRVYVHVGGPVVFIQCNGEGYQNKVLKRFECEWQYTVLVVTNIQWVYTSDVMWGW